MKETFYYTVITSPQWKAWQKEQNRRMQTRRKNFKGVYDMPEVMECGLISQEHFQEFLKFVVTTHYEREG